MNKKSEKKRRGFKFYLNIFTFMALIALVFFAREDILHAWNLLFTIQNWWLLLFLIPLQILVYYSMSEIGISYLEKRGQIKKIHWWEKAKMALELNFVNHVMPSGGASGFGYGLWRLKQVGVEKTPALMSQLIRTVFSFVAFAPLLLIAALWIGLRNNSNSAMVMIATMVSVALVFLVIFGGYLISSKTRITDFSNWFSKTVNKLINFITFRKIAGVISPEKLLKSFSDFHADYVKIIQEKKVLRKPFIWGIIWILVDIAMFEVTFCAMGIFIDPMVLLLAYGASCVAGFFVLTPGGTGAYEAAFIMVLVANGVNGDIAISGTLLTRIILMIGTLITGYYFYHKVINRKESKSSEK